MKQFLRNLSKILFVSFIAFPAFGETIKVGFAVPLTGEYAPYAEIQGAKCCLLYTSPSPRDRTRSRMPSSA